MFVVAALVGRAPGAVALDLVGVLLLVAVLGALVVRANRFAALGLLALAVLAFDLVGVVDQSVTAVAVDGVTVLRF